jgi:hypothetical protein
VSKLFYSILFLSLQTPALWACCAEANYRLYPIGEWQEKVLFIEFDLYRNCELGTGGEPQNEFWTKGRVNLVYAEGERLKRLEKVDSFSFKECVCTYENYYSKTSFEAEMARSYDKALTKAQDLRGFSIAQPKEIYFNDSIHTKVEEEISDTAFTMIVHYKDLISIDLSAEGIISCYPTQVAEVRNYRTENYEVCVLRLRCRTIEKESIKHIEERFNKIETAFWKEKAQWHGLAKDFFLIKQ